MIPVGMLALPAGGALAAASLISATISPHDIALGQSAQMTITTLGNDLGGLSLPMVGGLGFSVVGQTHRGDDVHGASVPITITKIRVTPLISGDFEIPGMAPNSPPLTLHVEGDEPGAKSPHRPPVPPAAGEHVPLTADGAAFVRLVLPKREVFVGESVPIVIEVGLQPGVITSLNGLPTLTNADFTLNNLSRQPERSERVVDGSPFSILTWNSVIAPVKPGTYTLAAESPVTLRIRLRSAADAKLDAVLGDPFMQNYYGKSVKKELKIASPPATLTVLSLPAEGRPPDFRGAVGTFSVASEIAPAGGAAGDPLTLRLRVSGAGNFDRVDSAMLERVDRWKAYPPKASFKPADATGYTGVKTFEEPLIPAQAGAQALPPLRFSYFDPQARRYATLETPPLAVTITAAPGERAPKSGGASGLAARAEESGGLRPDHAESGPTVRSLLPLYMQPRFLAIAPAFALLYAGAWWRTRRRPSAPTPNAPPSDPKMAEADARASADIEAAARARDPAGFATTARDALRRAFALRWQLKVETITTGVVAARLGDGGRNIIEVFRIADEIQYSGLRPAPTDLGRWSETLRTELSRVGRA